MNRKPKLFRTFFMKDEVIAEEGMAFEPFHEQVLSASPVINNFGSSFSNYERGTHEFEVNPAFIDQEEKEDASENFIEPIVYGINLDSLRPELASEFIESKRFFDSYFDLTKPGWDGPDKMGPMRYWCHKDPKYYVFHTEVDIDAPLETVAQLLVDEQFGFRYDKSRKYNVELRKESPQCKLFHYGINGTWPVSGRDMLVYRFEYYEDKDTFRLHTMPVKDMDHPSPKGMVRADLFVQGACLKRLEGNRTRYSNSSMFNPCVSGVPMFLLRGAVKDASKISVHFKEEVEKENAGRAY